MQWLRRGSESACNVGNPGWIPESGRSPGKGNSNPLQYSCLENPMNRGVWWATVHRVAKSQTQLSDFTFTFLFHTLEKEMATHSNILAWRIPGIGEPGGLPSVGSHRVRHDWSDLAAAESYLRLRGWKKGFPVTSALLSAFLKNAAALCCQRGYLSLHPRLLYIV